MVIRNAAIYFSDGDDDSSFISHRLDRVIYIMQIVRVWKARYLSYNVDISALDVHNVFIVVVVVVVDSSCSWVYRIARSYLRIRVVNTVQTRFRAIDQKNISTRWCCFCCWMDGLRSIHCSNLCAQICFVLCCLTTMYTTKKKNPVYSLVNAL